MYFLRFWRDFDTSTISPRLPHHKCRQFLEVFGALQGALEGDFSLQSYWDAWIENVAYLEQMDIFNLLHSNLAAPETPRSTFTFMASDDLTGEHAERSEDGDDEAQNEEAESKMDDELLFAGCLCDSDVSNGADHTEQECGAFEAPNGLNADQDHIGDIIPKASETFLADEDAETNADGNAPVAGGGELPRVDGEFAEQPDDIEEKAHSIAETEEQQQDEDQDDASSKEGKEDGDMIPAEHALDEEPSIPEEQQQDEEEDDASSKEDKEDGDMFPAEQPLDEEPSFQEEQQQDKDQDDASSKEGEEDVGMVPSEQPLDEEPSFLEEQQLDEEDDASSKEGKEDGGMVPAEQPLDQEPSFLEEQQQDEDQDASSKEGKEDGDMIPAEQPLDQEPSFLEEEQQEDEQQDDASSKEGKEDCGMVPAEQPLDEEPSILEEQQQDEDQDASSKEGKEDGDMIPAEQPLDEEPSFLEEEQQEDEQQDDASSKEGKEDCGMVPAEQPLDEEPSILEEQQQDEDQDDASSKEGKEDGDMIPAEQPLDDEPSMLEEQLQDEDQDDASSKEGKEDGGMVPAEHALDEEPSMLEEQQQDEDQDDASSKEGKEDGDMNPAEKTLDEKPSIPEEQQQDEEEDDASSKEGKEDGDMIPAEHALDEEPSIVEEQQQDEDQDDASSKEGKEDGGMIPAEQPLDEEPSFPEEQQQDEDQDDASSKEGKEDGDMIPAEHPLDEEPSIAEEQQQDEDQDDASSKEGKEDGDMIPAEQPLDEEPSIPMPLQADVSKNPTDLHAQVVDEALADSTLLATADVNADALSTGGHQESGHMSDEQLGWLGLNEDGILEDETAVADDVQSPGKAHSEMDADCNSPAADSDELPGVDGEFAEQPDESEEKAHSIAEPEEQQKDEEEDDASSKEDKEDGSMIPAEHALDEEPSIAEEQQQDEDQDDASSKEGKEDGDMIPAEQPLDEEPSIPMPLQADVSKNPTDLHAQVVDEALADSTLLATADVNADALSTGGHQESGHMSDEQLGWLGLNEDGILEDETAVADDVQSPGKAHSEMDADCNSPAADSDELPGVDGEFAEQPDESEEKTHSIAEPEEQQKDEEEDGASSKEDKDSMIPAEHALDEEFFISVKSSAEREDVAEFQAETDRHELKDGIDEFQEDTGQMGAVGCQQLFQIMSLWFVVALSGKRLVPTQLNHLTKFIQRADINMTLFWPSQDVAKPLCPGFPRQCERRMKAPWKIWRTQWRACGWLYAKVWRMNFTPMFQNSITGNQNEHADKSTIYRRIYLDH